MATLRDLDPQPFEVAPVDDPPAAAAGDRWLVLVRRGRPVSALAPGTVLSKGSRLPGILVAAADMNLAEALESDAFRQLTEFSALVVTEPSAGQADQPGIAGVVTGQTLAQVILRGTTRGIFGPLPGASSIPLITRSCGFAEGGVTCATMMPFEARPNSMPGCLNDRGLTAHPFAW